MKKNMCLCAALVVAVAFTSCKSQESAYKKMYDKAQARTEAQVTEPTPTETPVVAPVVVKPATETTVVDNNDGVPVRTEDVTLISGSGLKSYSVVVGSFGVKANAEGMQSQLKAAGYDAQIVYNSVGNTYRVVASTFNTKAEAVQSRDQFRNTYAGAWLLYKK